MACRCVDRLNGLLQKSNPNAEISMALMLDGRKYEETPIMVELTHRSGDQRRKKQLPKLFATFCPFCGVRYQQKEATEAPGEAHA